MTDLQRGVANLFPGPLTGALDKTLMTFNYNACRTAGKAEIPSLFEKCIDAHCHATVLRDMAHVPVREAVKAPLAAGIIGALYGAVAQTPRLQCAVTMALTAAFCVALSVEVVKLMFPGLNLRLAYLAWSAAWATLHDAIEDFLHRRQSGSADDGEAHVLVTAHKLLQSCSPRVNYSAYAVARRKNSAWELEARQTYGVE
jgi:hypothetical protein